MGLAAGACEGERRVGRRVVVGGGEVVVAVEGGGGGVERGTRAAETTHRERGMRSGGGGEVGGRLVAKEGEEVGEVVEVIFLWRWRCGGVVAERSEGRWRVAGEIQAIGRAALALGRTRRSAARSERCEERRHEGRCFKGAGRATGKWRER